MPVETATKISELVETNPLGSDPRSEGDNHLRLIKTVLKAFIAAGGLQDAADIPAYAGNGGKLLALNALATAFEFVDQLTAAQIKTLYESNANTNAFTDALQTKLTGIETAADVTDAANVDAAGATMNADTTLVGNGYFLDEDSFTSNDATKVASQQSIKAYVDALSSVYQALDATLTSIAALGTAADVMLYTTAVDTWAEATLTSFIRTLLDDTDAATARTTLGVGSTDSPTFDGVTLTKPAALPSYTVAGVPSASPAGQIIYVSDETGGAIIAFSDGTNWRRVTDRAVIA